MLKLAAEPTFKAKVGIPIPGGKPEMVEFTFRHRTRDEFDTLMKEAKEKPKSDTDFVLDIVTGWALTDAFTRENVELLLQNYHGASGAIGTTYATELSGAGPGN